MGNKNTSDSIEAYIKALLSQAGIAEIKRSELADVFKVVPSQINYVIKTRFTESRGYIVESKRLFVTATDEVLGMEADRIRSSIVQKIIQQVDRKGL